MKVAGKDNPRTSDYNKKKERNPFHRSSIATMHWCTTICMKVFSLEKILNRLFYQQKILHRVLELFCYCLCLRHYCHWEYIYHKYVDDFYR